MSRDSDKMVVSCLDNDRKGCNMEQTTKFHRFHRPVDAWLVFSEAWTLAFVPREELKS